jgi:hypothetical protein
MKRAENDINTSKNKSKIISDSDRMVVTQKQPKVKTQHKVPTEYNII